MGYAEVIIWVNQLLVEVKPISDADMMYLFFEKVMRKGVSDISKRYSQVNNEFKWLQRNWNPELLSL